MPEVQILLRFTLQPAVSYISHILPFSIDSYVKRPPKKEQKNLPNIQKFKFHNSLYKFGRDPS